MTLTLPATQELVTVVFHRFNAIRETGHFALPSGKHCGSWVSSAVINTNVDILSGFGYLIADTFREDNIELIVAIATAGIPLAQQIARHLNPHHPPPVIFAEEIYRTDRKAFAFIREYEKLIPGKRTLIADDIINEGTSMKQIVKMTEKKGGVICGVTCMCHRGTITAEELGVPRLHYLSYLPVETWEPLLTGNCPLCKKRIDIDQEHPRSIQFVKRYGQPTDWHSQI
jgi:orotate phosphoribosyltransferase